MSHLLQPFAIFAFGCLLIHVGRPYARATTWLLSTTALVLGVTLGGVLCQRTDLPYVAGLIDGSSIGRPGQ